MVYRAWVLVYRERVLIYRARVLLIYRARRPRPYNGFMQNLPNRQSIRLRGFDYSQNGLYFCTICTHDRENLFGEIIDGKMVLNNAGKIIDYWLNQIPTKYNGVILDEYQIMPNHIHIIINIVGAGFPRPKTLGQILAYFKYQSAKSVRLAKSGAGVVDLSGAETAPLQNKWVYIKKIFQRNYYEHIIRDENEYTKICNYIQNNPKNWEKDKNNIHIIPQQYQ